MKVIEAHNHESLMTTADLQSWTNSSSRVRRRLSNESEYGNQQRAPLPVTHLISRSYLPRTNDFKGCPPDVLGSDAQHLMDSPRLDQSVSLSSYAPSYVSFVRSFVSLRSDLEETLASFSRLGVDSLEVLVLVLSMAPSTFIKWESNVQDGKEDQAVFKNLRGMARALRADLMTSEGC